LFTSPIPGAPRCSTVGNAPTADRRPRFADSKIGCLRNIFRSRNFADKVTLGVRVSIGLVGNFPLFGGEVGPRNWQVGGKTHRINKKRASEEARVFLLFCGLPIRKTPPKGEFLSCSLACEIRIGRSSLRR